MLNNVNNEYSYAAPQSVMIKQQKEEEKKMESKKCSKCSKVSYSSCNEGNEWECPFCGNVTVVKSNLKILNNPDYNYSVKLNLEEAIKEAKAAEARTIATELAQATSYELWKKIKLNETGSKKLKTANTSLSQAIMKFEEAIEDAVEDVEDAIKRLVARMEDKDDV